jgi:hypothetical protein
MEGWVLLDPERFLFADGSVRLLPHDLAHLPPALASRKGGGAVSDWR